MSSSIIKSDNGVTSGVTGIVQTAGSDGTLQLQTTSSGGTATTAVTIDTSQNVGIGTTSVTSGWKMQVNGSTLNTGSLSSTYGDPNFNSGGSRTFIDWDGTKARIGTVLGGSTGGPVAFYVNNAEVSRFDTSGNLLVGTTSNSNGAKVLIKQTVDNNFAQAFSIQKSSNTDTWQQMVDGTTGNLYFAYNAASRGYINSTTGAYTATSDERAKKNIVELNAGLEEILKLRPVEYNMIDEADGVKKHIGLIAQEVKAVIDNAVDDLTDANLMYGLDKSGLVPVLIKAIQELKATITDLQAKLKSAGVAGF
jgi:trimeric autotransporter adhesin